MTKQEMVVKTVCFCGADAVLLDRAQWVRMAVFHEEQGIDQALDSDGDDETAFHVLALKDEKPIGTVRMAVSGECGRVGRLCVLKAFRSQGIGRRLMREIEDGARREGIIALELHSQVSAAGFYLKLGYEKVGPPFEEAGIPHVRMKKNLKTQ
jgi:predicted GNAT family N-acyltransferase